MQKKRMHKKDLFLPATDEKIISVSQNQPKEIRVRLVSGESEHILGT